MSREKSIAAGWKEAKLSDHETRYGPENSLMGAGLYTGFGVVYRTCPRLLKLDKRHGVDHRKWPAAWRDPAHAEFLSDPEGHDVDVYIYVPGSRPETADEWPSCPCGQSLVCSDGDAI